MASSTVENYLKSILQLNEGGNGTVSVGAIAESLAVTPGTVSAMMKSLSAEGLIDYAPRRHVSLLPKGRLQALQVVRRHRLIETFLVTTMKLDWSEVREEAEVLEHVVSDRLLTRMDEMLGHPSHDPHGDPIPDEFGTIPGNANGSESLATVVPGSYRFLRVDDSDIPLLNWLREHRLLPGCTFEVSDQDKAVGILEISLPERPESIRIGIEAAGKMLVEPAEHTDS